MMIRQPLAYKGKPKFLLTYVDKFGRTAEVFTQLKALNTRYNESDPYSRRAYKLHWVEPLMLGEIKKRATSKRGLHLLQMASEGPVTIREAAERLGLSRTTCAFWFQRLHAENRIALVSITRGQGLHYTYGPLIKDRTEETKDK